MFFFSYWRREMPLHSGNGRPPPPPNRISKKRHDLPKHKLRIQNKDMPAQHKFETTRASLPGHMFQHATELLSWKDIDSPAPSYSTTFSEWREAAEDVISEIIAADEAMKPADQESFEVGKEVAFRALEKFVKKATAVGWSQQGAEARAAAAKELLERPQVPQRTQAWYEQGKQVLTASEFSKLLGTPRAVSQLVGLDRLLVLARPLQQVAADETGLLRGRGVRGQLLRQPQRHRD
jgi:hypothetical protein